MPGIFICYRREDSGGHAGRIYDRLTQHFGSRQPIFIDVDSVDPGMDFVDAIQQTVASCDVLIAVIGRNWVTATDEEGKQRLGDPHDFVRLEIEAALDRNIRVIPALVSGARMPRTQDLPNELAKLTRRQAIEISDASFKASAARLIEALERTVNPPAHHSRDDRDDVQSKPVDDRSRGSSQQEVKNSSTSSSHHKHDAQFRKWLSREIASRKDTKSLEQAFLQICESYRGDFGYEADSELKHWIWGRLAER